MLSLRLTLSVNLYISLPLVLCAFVCTCCNPPCKLHTCTQVQPLPPSSGRGPSTSWPRPASWRSSVGIGSSGVLEPCCSERRGKKKERKRYDICIASLCVYTVIYSGSRWRPGFPSPHLFEQLYHVLCETVVLRTCPIRLRFRDCRARGWRAWSLALCPCRRADTLWAIIYETNSGTLVKSHEHLIYHKQVLLVLSTLREEVHT